MQLLTKVSIRGRKAEARRRARREGKGEALTTGPNTNGCDKKQSPYKNNNAVSCKQGKTETPAHSLGTGLSTEMRSAKFLITETLQEYSANERALTLPGKTTKTERNKRINIRSSCGRAFKLISLTWQTISFR